MNREHQEAQVAAVFRRVCRRRGVALSWEYDDLEPSVFGRAVYNRYARRRRGLWLLAVAYCAAWCGLITCEPGSFANGVFCVAAIGLMVALWFPERLFPVVAFDTLRREIAGEITRELGFPAQLDGEGSVVVTFPRDPGEPVA